MTAIWSPFTVVPIVLLGLCLWMLAELPCTPEGLWLSARKGWTWLVRAAARNGVPLDLPDELGETALMQAADAGHTDVVKVLLLEGVDTRAVSSLGQTAVEIAYARGRGDIVALLQKEARPPRPRSAGPGRQPSARAWLFCSMLLGASLVAAYNWIYDPWPTVITFKEVEELVQARQLKTITVTGRGIRGDTTAPGKDQPGTPFQGQFWAEAPGEGNAVKPDAITMLRTTNPNLIVNAMAGAGHEGRPPSRWSLALVLGIPAVLAVLLGWPVGARFWFPMLRSGSHLRS
jgi:hypothetical protein